jgi:hypothetical protein
MLLTLPQGGSLETFPRYDFVCGACLRRIRSDVERHDARALDLWCQGFCGVHGDRVAAELDPLLHPVTATNGFTRN